MTFVSKKLEKKCKIKTKKSYSNFLPLFRAIFTGPFTLLGLLALGITPAHLDEVFLWVLPDSRLLLLHLLGAPHAFTPLSSIRTFDFRHISHFHCFSNIQKN